MPLGNASDAAKASRKRRNDAYRERHPERIKAFDKRYYEANREKVLAKNAAWRAANRDKTLATERKRAERLGSEGIRLRNVRHLYGLSERAYFDLLGEQNGTCALCGMLPEGKRLHVDHEHVVNLKSLPPDERAATVRGLLCMPCNIFIGACGEDPDIAIRKALELAKRVATYLRKDA